MAIRSSLILPLQNEPKPFASKRDDRRPRVIHSKVLPLAPTFDPSFMILLSVSRDLPYVVSIGLPSRIPIWHGPLQHSTVVMKEPHPAGILSWPGLPGFCL